MSNLYKVTEFKHPSEENTIEIFLENPGFTSVFRKVEEIEINQLTSEEKDLLLESLVNEVKSLKSSLEDMQSTLANHNLIGE